jgi:hypothetical protein
LIELKYCIPFTGALAFGTDETDSNDYPARQPAAVLLPSHAYPAHLP